MPTPNYGLKQYTSSSTETFGSMIDSVLGTDEDSNVSKIDVALGNKTDKAIPAANGNIATLDANGNLLDGGVTVDKLQPAINEITADVSINDGDYVPLYDTGTSTHKKSLWSNIIAKIRAVLFGTSNGILKANGSGVISTATAGTDYAEADHGHSADDIIDGVTNKAYTSSEKNKLTGIEAEANKYTHPTTPGNKHIPSGGSSGQFLKYSADGTAVWGDGNITPLSDANPLANGAAAPGTSANASRADHVHPSDTSKLDANKITFGTTDLTAGTSPLATGSLYFVYE